MARAVYSYTTRNKAIQYYIIISTSLTLLLLYNILVRSLAGSNISQQLHRPLNQHYDRTRPDHEGRIINRFVIFFYKFYFTLTRYSNILTTSMIFFNEMQ